MKKIWIVGLLIVLLIVLVGVSSSHNNKSSNNDNEPIKVGVLAPLSGVLARFGEWTVRGAQLAVDEINAEGGIDGRQIELVVEDDECLGAQAVSAVTKMQSVDGINMIVSYCTPVSSAIAPVTKDKSIVFAPTFKLTQLVQADFPHYIAMQPSMLFEVSKLFEYVQQEEFTKIAILYTTNDFWISYRDAVITLAEQHGIIISTIEEADFLANDFRTQLSKIEANNPDVIFGGLNPGPLGNMLKQRMELQIDIPVVSVWATEAPDILERGGEAADGVVYTYYYENGFTERNEEYVEAYTSMYKEEPELISASTYDVFYILKDVVEKCGDTDLECMVKETHTIKNYEGASGIFTFVDGATIKDTFLKTIKDGKFIRYKN